MCRIKLLEDSRTNIYMLLYGFIQGLYDTDDYPKTGCKRCEKLARPFSEMVFGLGNVLNMFNDLISDNNFADFVAVEQI